MTKKEAIKKVKAYLTDYLPQEEYDEVEEIVETLQPPKWIPVSEELPEAGYSVLVTRITNNGDTYKKIASYQEECWMDDTDKYGEPNSDTVIAWQPLPEPYKEESEVQL